MTRPLLAAAGKALAVTVLAGGAVYLTTILLMQWPWVIVPAMGALWLVALTVAFYQNGRPSR